MPYTGDKIAVTCPECLGEGYVEIRKNYKLTGKKKLCPKCGGDGATISTHYSEEWLND